MSESNIKAVVVGVDFSSYSKIVVRQAIKLADKYDAKIVFVHALSSMLYTSGYMSAVDFFVDIANPMKEEINKFYKVKNLKNKEIYVELGAASDVIMNVAKNYNNPLIIVGHRGSSALGRFFLGSNAERLALQSPYPVWIHRGNTVKMPKKILLPCDFSDRTENALATAKELGNGKKPIFELFHIQQMPLPILDASNFKIAMTKFNKYESSKRKAMEVRHPEVPLKAQVGDPAVGIAKESKKFDLIAMAPHNRKGLFSHFGSVTAKVVRSGNVPVLITH